MIEWRRMTKKVIRVIDIQNMGRLKRIRVHRSPLGGLTRYERNVMSYEEY